MNTTASNDRKLVLEMLADGKITVEDAEKLLAKLEEVENYPEETGETDGTTKRRATHLRIVATDDDEGDSINLRIPLGLVRAGLTLDSFLPRWARSRIFVATSLSDVSQIDTDYLRDNLDDLDLTYDSEDGESIRIFVE